MLKKRNCFSLRISLSIKFYPKTAKSRLMVKVLTARHSAAGRDMPLP